MATKKTGGQFSSRSSAGAQRFSRRVEELSQQLEELEDAVEDTTDSLRKQERLRKEALQKQIRETREEARRRREREQAYKEEMKVRRDGARDLEKEFDHEAEVRRKGSAAVAKGMADLVRKVGGISRDATLGSSGFSPRAAGRKAMEFLSSRLEAAEKKRESSMQKMLSKQSVSAYGGDKEDGPDGGASGKAGTQILEKMLQGTKFGKMLPKGVLGGAGGLLGKLKGAGPWGMVADALGETIGLAVDAAVEVKNDISTLSRESRRRFLSYGRGEDRVGPGTRFKTQAEADEGARQEVLDIAGARMDAKRAALIFDVEASQLEEAQDSIAHQTGQMFSKMADTTNLMAEMSAITGMSVSEAADIFIKERRRFNAAPEKVLKSMENLMDQSRAITNETGRVINVEDYVKEVKDLKDSIGTDLGVTLDETSRTFSAGMKTALKMGMAVDKAIKGSKELTESLLRSYDEGFATVEVGQDIQGLLARKDLSAEERAFVQQLEEDRQTGAITDDQAQKFLRQRMGGKLTGVRLARTLEDGNFNLAQARLGGDLTDDVYSILRDLKKQVESGSMTAEQAAERAMQLTEDTSVTAERQRAVAAQTALSMDLGKVATAVTQAARNEALKVGMDAGGEAITTLSRKAINEFKTPEMLARENETQAVGTGERAARGKRARESFYDTSQVEQPPPQPVFGGGPTGVPPPTMPKPPALNTSPAFLPGVGAQVPIPGTPGTVSVRETAGGVTLTVNTTANVSASELVKALNSASTASTTATSNVPSGSN